MKCQAVFLAAGFQFGYWRETISYDVWIDVNCCNYVVNLTQQKRLCNKGFEIAGEYVELKIRAWPDIPSKWSVINPTSVCFYLFSRGKIPVGLSAMLDITGRVAVATSPSCPALSVDEPANAPQTARIHSVAFLPRLQGGNGRNV